MSEPHAKSAVESVLDRSAEELGELVRRRLCGRVQGFQLVVQNDGVVLRGKTSSYYFKQLAQQTVMEASHARIVANEILVAYGDRP